eukprot:scaffold156973_cov20-Prasinocladus_malaysianus.AAC.1
MPSTDEQSCRGVTRFGVRASTQGLAAEAEWIDGALLASCAATARTRVSTYHFGTSSSDMSFHPFRTGTRTPAWFRTFACPNGNVLRCGPQDLRFEHSHIDMNCGQQFQSLKLHVGVKNLKAV